MFYLFDVSIAFCWKETEGLVGSIWKVKLTRRAKADMEQKYPIGCGDGSSQIYGASTVTLRAMN